MKRGISLSSKVASFSATGRTTMSLGPPAGHAATSRSVCAAIITRSASPCARGDTRVTRGRENLESGEARGGRGGGVGFLGGLPLGRVGREAPAAQKKRHPGGVFLARAETIPPRERVGRDPRRERCRHHRA